ncbi:MAG TPA: FAD-dependent oxidoreductase [Bryobacteraceae bacterium]|nr:FAD-dependent oxidoreductase [Bryobacteraceae bacterium]HPQ13589.1 FAD-dependent oxidoreductase [Bryobacteraceae bacterium]
MLRFIFLLIACSAAFGQQAFDLVVYGGTAAGVMTAVAGARGGLNTVLLEPRANVGGMATGGLSRTDVGKREVIGGLALEFYYRVGMRYQMFRHLNPVSWFYEPHVGESVMKEMLNEAGVKVLYHRRLREKDGVRKQGTRVTEIVMENGEVYAGKIFADCSYEGDLMAQAKVTYTWGRESMAQYGESLAGIRERTPYHQFQVDIPARDEDGRLLPEISAEPRGEPGAADRRVQAYNFRVIATNNPVNRIPWPKPRNYDPRRYELLARLLAAMEKKLGRPQVFNELTLIANIPNQKADFNNQDAFSTDYIGKNYDYPDGSYRRREEIWQDHIDYVQGFYYFLANDPRVPRSLQMEVREWGLCKDEFEDTGHWPHQLYIREGRRMVGEYVMVQKDLQTDRLKPDVIGMGSYNSDSHNVQRFVNAAGFVENEGDMQVPVQPYQIPYRVMLPKRTEATNLLVPVCFSASHVAYSSLRMEPQYMIIGHAAGVAAGLAIRANKPVQEIDVPELQKILKSQAAVFEYVPSPQQQALDILRRALRPSGPALFNWE